MTNMELIAAHRELWTWCSENPKKGKWEWPEWKSNGGKYPSTKNHCFLCEAPYCCLVVWPLVNKGFGDSHCAIFYKWSELGEKWKYTKDDQYLLDSRDIAKQIANLPAREVETTDGYKFIYQPDGSYTDGDMTFDSYDAIVQAGHI